MKFLKVFLTLKLQETIGTIYRFLKEIIQSEGVYVKLSMIISCICSGIFVHVYGESYNYTDKILIFCLMTVLIVLTTFALSLVSLIFYNVFMVEVPQWLKRNAKKTRMIINGKQKMPKWKNVLGH